MMEEWKQGLEGLLQDAAKPCNCGFNGRAQAVPQAIEVRGCGVCLDKIQGAVADLEKLAKASDARMELEAFIERQVIMRPVIIDLSTILTLQEQNKNL